MRIFIPKGLPFVDHCGSGRMKLNEKSIMIVPHQKPDFTIRSLGDLIPVCILCRLILPNQALCDIYFQPYLLYLFNINRLCWAECRDDEKG